MRNPYDIYVHETVPRQTIWRMSKETGISQPAIYKWFNNGVIPRGHNLAILAKFMKCTKEEAMQAVKRAHHLKKAGYKLPFALILEPTMLQAEYDAMVNDQNTRQSAKNPVG